MKKSFLSILMIITVASLALSACTMVRGSGNIITETRTVSGFNAVELVGAGRLVLTESDAEKLVIGGDDNLVALIETQVRGSKLVISYKNNASVFSASNMVFYVDYKTLESVTLTGSGSVENTTFSGDALTVSINGSGKVNFDDITVDALTTNITGTGTMQFTGKAETQNVNIAGSGSYNGESLESENATVSIFGAGKIVVWVNAGLETTISGTGEIQYYGNPTVSETNLGSGGLKPMGDK